MQQCNTSSKIKMNHAVLEQLWLRTTKYVAGVLGVGIVGYNTLCHLYPSRKYARNEICQSPSDRYASLLKEVCWKMDVDSDKVRLFYNKAFGVISGGTLYGSEPSVIGLPRNCSFNTTEDIRNAPIYFEDKPFNWDSKLGKSMQDVLLVSDVQAKFIMAHELVHIQNLHFVHSTLHMSGFLVGSYFLGTLVAKRYRGSLNAVVSRQLAAWLIGFLGYWTSRQQFSHWMENNADEKSAQLGLDYVDGGIEQMRKRLKLNRILRRAHGVAGEKLYSEKGDDLRTLSTHPSRTERLKRLKEIKKSMAGKDGDDGDDGDDNVDTVKDEFSQGSKSE